MEADLHGPKEETMNLSYVFCFAGLALVTWLIWQWNRGAQRRRFRKAFPGPRNPVWQEEDEAFLRAFESAYRLRPGMAEALPPDATPMSVYLVLYPEHCIYDDCEPARFRAKLADRLGPQSEDVLTTPLGVLAKRWRTVPERSRA